MEAKRAKLTVGEVYRLKDHDEAVLECIRLFPNDQYSPFTSKLRSTKTGWTMTAHGVNMYPDGSIDWDFSTGGIFTERDENGILHGVSLETMRREGGLC